jgi:hypothetical protein
VQFIDPRGLLFRIEAPKMLPGNSFKRRLQVGQVEAGINHKIQRPREKK